MMYTGNVILKIARGMMGFFDKLKQFQNQISEVENSIYTNKQDFLEIYERNIQLEKEISERTKELNVANQRMLTLQHVWDMMNSSKPLSNVLESIVKTLQGEIGYLHCCIVQKNKDDDGNYMEIITQSDDELVQNVDKILDQQFNTLRLNYDENGIFAKTLVKKDISQTTDLRLCLKSAAPFLSEDSIRKLLNSAKTRSIIIIPIYAMNVDFGWLIVFSSRDSAEEPEVDFLKLFTKQIELAITIADLFEAVKNQAVTDALTTLYNRRYFEEYLNKEVTRSQRMNQPFTIVALDLDHLKQINDKYGHSYGDLAIKTVADVLKKNARSIDVAARMGGEEFNVLLPGVDSKGGLVAAERIRSAIAACELDQIGQITASIGVATFLEHSDKVDELLEIADQAMYMSKRNGRNQVQLAKPITEISWQEVAINTFMDILSKKRVPIPTDISNSLYKKLSKSNVNDESTPKDTLYNIADMLAKTYNPLHGKGVTKSKVQMATKLAKIFELSKDETDKLRIATLLYDIGNLMLPQDLLQKKEPLTDDEKDQIKTHPVIAAREILEPISEVQDIIPIIEHHHENWDGSGYPGKVSGEQIPLSSQIILITDAYFALTEPRSYRKALSAEDAIEIIKNDSNKKWNPALVKEFVGLVKNDLNRV